jgi:hypothetical protein
MNTDLKKYIAIVTVILISSLSLFYTAAHLEQDPITEPDHYEFIALEKGKECYRSVNTISLIAVPYDIQIPEGLSWLEYGFDGAGPITKFWMGGVPDEIGFYLVSFYVGLLLVHLEFEIWEHSS